jgi:hypothetical protein
MPLLRCGLNAGAVLTLVAFGASWMAGYTVEVALLRGLLAFPLVAFAGYFAELVISTAPPATAATPTASDGTSSGRKPADLAQARSDRDASAERRAA